MILDAQTETGAVYRLDLDRFFWLKYRDGMVESPTERLIRLMIGTSLTNPMSNPDDWEEADLPEVGKHLFVASLNAWYVSTPIVEVRETTWQSGLDTGRRVW